MTRGYERYEQFPSPAVSYIPLYTLLQSGVARSLFRRSLFRLTPDLISVTHDPVLRLSVVVRVSTPAVKTNQQHLSYAADDADRCPVRDVHCDHRGSGAAPEAAAPARDQGKQGARPPRWGRRRQAGDDLVDHMDQTVPRVPEALQGDRWADHGLPLVLPVRPRRYPLAYD